MELTLRKAPLPQAHPLAIVRISALTVGEACCESLLREVSARAPLGFGKLTPRGWRLKKGTALRAVRINEETASH